MPDKRTVFFISDRTGITAEMLGHSLLTQFRAVPVKKVTVPFVDTPDKARAIKQRIEDAAADSGSRPLVFSTIVNQDVREALSSSNAMFVDLFDEFIRRLETELGAKPSHEVGLLHGMSDYSSYQHRIEAVNYALTHDDGITTKNFERADVILLGVSRSGKTPTCLYLAMQYGIQGANFPLTPEDFSDMRLPPALAPHRRKLYGLTILPERLQQIRAERRRDSRYAAIDNCRYEVRQAELLYHAEGIPYLDTTNKSIEEIASTIMNESKLERRLY